MRPQRDDSGQMLSSSPSGRPPPEQLEMDALQLRLLSSYKSILGVAIPAALFRVSSVLCATLQTSLVSRHGGADMLAAFATVGVTTKTAALLFAFLADGVAAKVGRSAAHEPAEAVLSRVRLYFFSCLVLGAATTAVLLGAREGILHPFHLVPPVYALARPYWSLLSLLVPLVLLNMAVSGTLQGLHQVGLSAALEAVSAIAEVTGAYMALTHPRLRPGTPRLCALALVKWAVAGAYAAVGLGLVAIFLPKRAQQGRGGNSCSAAAATGTSTLPGSCSNVGEVASIGASRQVEGVAGGERSSLSAGEEPAMEGWQAEEGQHDTAAGGRSPGRLPAGHPLRTPLLAAAGSLPPPTHLPLPLLPRTHRNQLAPLLHLPCRMHPQASGISNRCGGGSLAWGCSSRRPEDEGCLQAAPQLHWMRYVGELVEDGANIMVRSVLVQGSMWLTAVAAARLGTAPLAAHQVLTQLWMLPTHFSGGFAVSGIVLGSRLAREDGEGALQGESIRQAQWRLSSRLLLLSSSLGALVGCALMMWRAPVVAAFHPGADVAAALHGPAWSALCAMQPLTSALFTLTGLVYGAQYFAFMRNVLLVGFLFLFCPSLMWVVHRQEAEEGAATGGRGLGEVWGVKLAFYGWQLVAEGVGVARAYAWVRREALGS